MLPLPALYFMLRLSETVIQSDTETVQIIAINKNRREFLSIITFSTNRLLKPTENKSKKNKGVLHTVHHLGQSCLAMALSVCILFYHPKFLCEITHFSSLLLYWQSEPHEESCQQCWDRFCPSTFYQASFVPASQLTSIFQIFYGILLVRLCACSKVCIYL